MNKKVDVVTPIEEIHRQIELAGGDSKCCTIIAFAVDDKEGLVSLIHGEGHKLAALLHTILHEKPKFKNFFKEIIEHMDEAEREIFANNDNIMS